MCIFLNSHIRNAALHEAGHIVSAYFAEYSCNESIIDGDGNGMTKMNYGDDAPLAVAILNRNSWQQLFVMLPNHIKENAQPVAMRLCTILFAGGIVEAIHKHGRNFKGIAEVEISGPDLQHALCVCKHFQINSAELIKELYEIFKLNAFWLTTKRLARQLIKQKKLTKIEIETTISEEGFLEYLKTMESHDIRE